jgi:hypothetical protein
MHIECIANCAKDLEAAFTTRVNHDTLPRVANSMQDMAAGVLQCSAVGLFIQHLPQTLAAAAAQLLLQLATYIAAPRRVLHTHAAPPAVQLPHPQTLAAAAQMLLQLLPVAAAPAAAVLLPAAAAPAAAAVLQRPAAAS